MSLLQRALDHAENPDKEPLPEPEILKVPATKPSEKEKPAVLLKPAVLPAVQLIDTPAEQQHQAPRLNAIRFYETQNQQVEEAIQERARLGAAPKVVEYQKERKDSGWKILGLIFLLMLSAGAVKLFLPSAKTKIQVTPVSISDTAKPPVVVVKKQTDLAAKTTVQAKFLLTGITTSGDTMLALINNQVVGTGDKLREGATVKSITESRVVLDFDSKQIVLNF